MLSPDTIGDEKWGALYTKCTVGTVASSPFLPTLCHAWVRSLPRSDAVCQTETHLLLALIVNSLWNIFFTILAISFCCVLHHSFPQRLVLRERARADDESDRVSPWIPRECFPQQQEHNVRCSENLRFPCRLFRRVTFTAGL